MSIARQTATVTGKLPSPSKASVRSFAAQQASFLVLEHEPRKSNFDGGEVVMYRGHRGRWRNLTGLRAKCVGTKLKGAQTFIASGCPEDF